MRSAAACQGSIFWKSLLVQLAGVSMGTPRPVGVGGWVGGWVVEEIEVV